MYKWSFKSLNEFGLGYEHTCASFDLTGGGSWTEVATLWGAREALLCSRVVQESRSFLLLWRIPFYAFKGSVRLTDCMCATAGTRVVVARRRSLRLRIVPPCFLQLLLNSRHGRDATLTPVSCSSSSSRGILELPSGDAGASAKAAGAAFIPF